MKKIIFLVIAVAVVVGALRLYKVRVAQKEAQVLPTKRYYSVDLVDAQQKTLRKSREFLAQVDALKSADISTKLSGVIKKIYVSENSKVKKGDLLLSIDDVELKSTLESLKIQQNAQQSDLSYTKSIADRNKKLYKAGGLSHEKYEASLVAYKNKESIFNNTVQKIKQIKNQLSYLNIKAPFDGVVSKIILDEGSLAMASKPILALKTTKQKLIFKYAPSSDIKVLDKVLIDSKVVGEVAKIYDYTQNALLVAEVKLTQDIHMPNNAFIDVELITSEIEGCVVKQSTLLHKGDKTFVMSYNKDHFTQLEVDVKLESKDEAIVSPCPTYPVASANESKLAILASLGKVKVGR